VDAKLTHLYDLLLEEIALHEALEAELEAEAAKDGQIDGATLLSIQSKKNQQVRKIQSLELQRMALVEEIATSWSEEPAELTLRRIISRAPAEVAGNLARCHEKLIALVNRIRELAEVTANNAQARLKAIDATLSIINEAAKMHPTYSEKGRLQKKTPTFKQTSA
jgi:hypothetical protein